MGAPPPSYGLVTPEAVPLDLPVATVGSRGLAYLLDLVIVGALTLALAFAGSLLEGPLSVVPPWVGVTLVVLLVFGIQLGYPTLFETFWRGRTPGKAAMGLRVVTIEGAPVEFRHAAIRAALGLVDFLVTAGLAAVLSGFLTSRTQRLGDLVAGTIVLRERTGAGTAAATRFATPAGLETLAAQLDVSALGPADYQAARSLLQRAGSLRPDVRRRLADSLAATLAERVRPAPADDVSSVAWLQAVAAAYQRRTAPRARPAPTGTGDAGLPAVPPSDAPPPARPPGAEPPPGGGFAPPG